MEASRIHDWEKLTRVAHLRVQVKTEAVAAAQERLEASKAALEQRREELLAKEAQLKEAAHAAEAAASAAAAQGEKLRAREVMITIPAPLAGDARPSAMLQHGTTVRGFFIYDLPGWQRNARTLL